MKGNVHVQFGIGGGESDLSADHTSKTGDPKSNTHTCADAHTDTSANAKTHGSTAADPTSSCAGTCHPGLAAIVDEYRRASRL